MKKSSRTSYLANNQPRRRWKTSAAKLLLFAILLLLTVSLRDAQAGISPVRQTVGSSRFISRTAFFRQQATPPHPSVARITVAEGDSVSLGSGSLVGNHGEYSLVITNWHVVRDATGDVNVLFPNGSHSPARVLKVDRDWDLAALLIWRPQNIEPIQLSKSAPQPGDVLTIAGYGSGTYRAVSGRCTQYVAPGENFPYEIVELSAQARDGDSGGPIFNSQGQLAGVLFGASRGTTSGSYVGRVGAFLNSLPQLPASPPRQPRPENIASQVESASSANQQPASQAETIASVPSATRTPPVFEKINFSSTPSPLAEASEEATPQIFSWHMLAGESRFDQVKTILALIGLLAVFLQIARVLNP